MLLVLMIIIFILACPQKTAAKMVINEIFPHPADNQEWLELLYRQEGTEDQSLNLSSWSIEDCLTTPSTIYQFEQSLSIENEQYFLVTLSNKLNNSGDCVKLLDQNNVIQDEYNFETTSINKSFARFPNFIGSFVLSDPSQANDNPPPISATPTLTITATPLPTPSIIWTPTQSLIPATPDPNPTSTLTPSQNLSQKIILSEIMACPEDGKEWIELYNLSANEIQLHDLYLVDGQGKIFIFSDDIVSAKTYFLAEIKNKLNNNTDQVILKQNEIILDQFKYDSCYKNQSWCQIDNKWQICEISKNQPNELFFSHDEANFILGERATWTDQDTTPINIIKTPTINNLAKSAVLTTKKNIEAKKPENYHQASKSANLAPENLIFSENSAQYPAIVSVIIGGSILFFYALINLYEEYKQAQY